MRTLHLRKKMHWKPCQVPRVAGALALMGQHMTQMHSVKSVFHRCLWWAQLFFHIGSLVLAVLRDKFRHRLVYFGSDSESTKYLCCTWHFLLETPVRAQEKWERAPFSAASLVAWLQASAGKWCFYGCTCLLSQKKAQYETLTLFNDASFSCCSPGAHMSLTLASGTCQQWHPSCDSSSVGAHSWETSAFSIFTPWRASGCSPSQVIHPPTWWNPFPPWECDIVVSMAINMHKMPFSQ